MRNIVNEYIKMFEENRRARRKTLGVIGVLALFVTFGVFWNLHFTGIALTDEVYYCDKEEHEHDEMCYAWMLSDVSTDGESAEEAAADEITAADDKLSVEETVQADEVDPEVESVQAAETETTEDTEQFVESASADESTQTSELNEEEETEQTKEEASAEEAAAVEETGDSASETDELPAMVLAAEATESEEWYLNIGYVKTLICDKEEHTHTAQCLIDETADVETAEDWEATLPEELGDSAAENLVAVAFSQIGYTESSANYIFADDGVTHKGYTRYGAWYGNTYGDWDAMFVAFCLHYAGISEEDFPVNSGAYAWAAQLTAAELYAAADEYAPSAGDLIFLDTDEDGKADLVGIVESVDLDSLSVIMGDYCDESASNEGETTADAVCRIEYTSDDAAILGYGMLLKAVSGLVKQSLTVTVDDLTVTVSGLLPDGAKVSAEPVELELEDQEVQFALEIAIYDADGNEFEPEDDTITVTVESDTITGDCVIYYVPDEGDLEKVSSEAGDGTVSFEAKHFSTYAGITLTASSGSGSLTFCLVDTNGSPLEGSYDPLTYSSSLASWLPVQTVAINYIIDAAGSNSNYLYSGAYVGGYNETKITYIKYDAGSGAWKYSTSSSLPGSSESGTAIAGSVYLVFSEIASTEPEDITPGYSKYVSDNGDGTYDLTLTVTASESETETTKVDVIYVLDVSGSMIRDFITDSEDTNPTRRERLEAANSAMVTLTNELANDENIDARYSLVVFGGENREVYYYNNATANQSNNWSTNTFSYGGPEITDNYTYSESAYNDGKVWTEWTSSATEFIGNLPEDVNSTTKLGRGTNYEAGIYHTQSYLENAAGSSRDDAVTVVIFLSDGLPNYYYLDNDTETYSMGGSYYNYFTVSGAGATAGSGDATKTDNVNACLDEAIEQLTELYNTGMVDYFIAVAEGPVGFSERLERLAYLIKSTTTTYTAGDIAQKQSELEKQGVHVSVLSGESEEELNNAFSGIADMIKGIKLTFSDVTIEDTLSENVTAVVDSSDDSVTLTVKVTDENGVTITHESTTKSGTVSAGTITVANKYNVSGGSFTITATYDSSTKKIDLSFSDDYSLEDGWTYSATLTVGATEKAYERYYDNEDVLPDEGEKDTDAPNAAPLISSLMSGVFTNVDNSAILTYTYNGTEKTLEYPMPVIPLKFTNISVVKRSSESGVGLPGAEFILYRTNSEGDTVYYQYTESSGITQWVTDIREATTLVSDDDGKITLYHLYSASVDNGNEIYYLKETKASDGYNLLTDIVSFYVGNDGNPYVITGTSGDVTFAVVVDENLNVYDVPGYELPSTGGSGTILYTTTGLTLLISAAWLMYKQKRRRRERVRSG